MKNKNSNLTRLYGLIVGIFLFSVAITPLLAASDDQSSITNRMRNSLIGVDLPSAGAGEAVDKGVQDIIGNIINAFLGLFGVFFLVLTIYGGYIWMNARGNEEEVKKAKDILRSAIVGFIIVMLAYAISYFVTAALQGAVNPAQ